MFVCSGGWRYSVCVGGDGCIPSTIIIMVSW